MGEAKRRALNPPKVPTEEVASRIATAVRKICEASSRQLGVDCLAHAQLALHVLQQLGYDAELVSGEAAWRVGESDGAVVNHGHFGEDNKAVSSPNHYHYHVWIETGPMILDVTTYQLRMKMEVLDRMDKQVTCVEWCPDYLFVKRDTSSSMREVGQLHTGLYHYRKDAAIQAKVKQVIRPQHEQHLAGVMLAYHNPELNVIGSKQIER